MTETFTLAHFSDVHLSPIKGFTRRYWNTKRVLGYLNWQHKRRHLHDRDVADQLFADAAALQCDHTVVTGDLVNLGLPAEHEAALEWLRGHGTPDEITVVPGNHDFYSALHGDPGPARWAPYMAGEMDTLAFPFVRRVGPLALIGLNSAIETPPFVAEGRLGPHQIDVLADLLLSLAGKAIRVVLIHHPPLPGLTTPRRELKDAQHLVRVLARHGAELVLYGHNHRLAVDWIDGNERPIPVVAAASASAGAAHNDETLARYNLFTFFRNAHSLRVRHIVRGLDGPSRTITKISENFIEPARVRMHG